MVHMQSTKTTRALEDGSHLFKKIDGEINSQYKNGKASLKQAQYIVNEIIKKYQNNVEVHNVTLKSGVVDVYISCYVPQRDVYMAIKNMGVSNVYNVGNTIVQFAV